MVEYIRPNSSKIKRSDLSAEPILRQQLIISANKLKSNTRLTSPIALVKKSISSSRSPKLANNRSKNFFNPPQPNVKIDSQKFAKALQVSLKNTSSRKPSPIRIEKNQSRPTNPFVVKPSHRRVKSDIPTLTEKLLASPYIVKGRLANFQASNPNQKHYKIQEPSVIICPSQEQTLKKTHKRNLSEEDSDLHRQVSLNRSIGATFEKHETPRRENDENERQNLILAIISGFRKTGLPPKTGTDFYDLIKQLGKGSFGKVYLALNRLTGLKVAIKAIHKGNIKDERIRQKVFQEVFVMNRIHHVNVTRLLEIFESENHIMMVLEYSDGGDLLQLIKAKGKLNENEAKFLFWQVVLAVKACHDKNVIHRDIKLDNILLSNNFSVAKLCDFGVSRVAKRDQIIDEQCGTPAYLAPEIIVDRGYQPFYVDLWSMGVLLYAMICGTVPFKAKTLVDLHKLILKCKYSMPDGLSAGVQDLIKRLLNPIPHLRISLDDIMSHPWFDDCGIKNDEASTKANTEMADSEDVAIDKKILNKLFLYGFPQDYVLRSLKVHDINHATCCYQLLEMDEKNI
ncbi:unnamed protein product [Blepharisma stoltei]|uniref:Protein kinase domain-containing protein n=1 Tax=Blepharisma stoltei TaxID=1481888 RepID=A0AAU9J226_9CILI|nr:unnamed protein product [Blepharisma stoltei]